MYKKKSLLKNSMFSAIKTFSTILFPLLTYPYVTRVLDVDQLGAIDFGNSIVNYFLLIGTFGVSGYAVRSGSQMKDKQKELENFCSQVFSINVFFSIIAYLFFILLIFVNERLDGYKSLVLVQGLMIILTPFSIDWFYNIIEDFSYITYRTLIVQILSAILLFSIIKDNGDVLKYVIILIISGALGNMFNFYNSRRYIKIKITRYIHLENHIKKLVLFFINSVTSTIYLNSDITLLGIYCNDYAVGLYSVSTKIYSIAKQVFNSVVLTIIPRLSYYASKDYKRFENLVKLVVSFAVTFTIPATIGIFLLRKEIVNIIAGKKYLDSSNSLAILAFAIFFAVFANIFANGILIALGKEKVVVYATVISALLNVISNVFLIPLLRERGAAITTLMAEISMLVISVICVREIVKKVLNFKSIGDTLVGTVIMTVGFLMLKKVLFGFKVPIVIYFLSEILVSISLYILFLILVKNETIMIIMSLIKSKFFLRDNNNMIN